MVARSLRPDLQASLGLVGVAGPGGKFEVSTKAVLGVSEVEIANTLISGVSHIVATEMALGASSTPNGPAAPISVPTAAC